MKIEEVPYELRKILSQRVARECAVIASEADTNWDAEQEILTRFDIHEPIGPRPDCLCDLDKVREAITEFNKGCSNDGHLEGDEKRPAMCPECLAAFARAINRLCKESA